MIGTGYAHKFGHVGQRNNQRECPVRFFSLSQTISRGVLIRLCSPWWVLVLLFLTLAFPLFAHAQEIYTSQVYQVTLQYPTGWHRVEDYDEKCAGTGGFFQLSAGPLSRL